MAAALSSFTEKNFKFNTFAKVIAIVFDGDTTDCSFQFTTDDATTAIKQIKSHRKLLSTLSPVFATMFNGSWGGDCEPIRIDDVSMDAFETFLNYFYKSEVKLNTDNFDEVLYLAHKYDVQDVVACCSIFSMEHLSVDNVVACYGMAIRFEQNELKVKCIEFIANNKEHVLKSDTFIECDQNTLMEILKIRSPVCVEHVVFDVCIEWAKDKCHKMGIDEPSPESLRNQLGECFQLIRLKDMELDEFGKRIDLISAMMTKGESDDVLKYLVLTKSCATTQVKTDKTVKELDEGINLMFEIARQTQMACGIQGATLDSQCGSKEWC